MFLNFLLDSLGDGVIERDLLLKKILSYSDGWSGGAIDKSKTRAYCAYRRCGWGLFGHFSCLVYHFSPLSPSLRETVRYRLKYCLKGPLNPNQTSNQPSRLTIQQEAKM